MRELEGGVGVTWYRLQTLIYMPYSSCLDLTRELRIKYSDM